MQTRMTNAIKGVHRWASVLAVVAFLSVLTAGPALAIFPSLSTKMTGPALGGVVPTGEARVDQAELPGQLARLHLRVHDVNLPAGTTLEVIMTDCGPSPIATFVVSGHSELSTSLPEFCQVGRQSSILINHGATTILSGGAPWTF